MRTKLVVLLLLAALITAPSMRLRADTVTQVECQTFTQDEITSLTCNAKR